MHDMTILFLFKDSEEALKKEYITDEEKELWNTLVFPESVEECYIHVTSTFFAKRDQIHSLICVHVF